MVIRCLHGPGTVPSFLYNCISSSNNPIRKVLYYHPYFTNEAEGQKSKELAQGHTVRKWQSWNSHPGNQTAEPVGLTITASRCSRINRTRAMRCFKSLPPFLLSSHNPRSSVMLFLNQQCCFCFQGIGPAGCSQVTKVLYPIRPFLGAPLTADP